MCYIAAFTIRKYESVTLITSFLMYLRWNYRSVSVWLLQLFSNKTSLLCGLHRWFGSVLSPNRSTTDTESLMYYLNHELGYFISYFR
ncbi:hypothetical protein HanXRQr2_Chr01g0033261 [Helianthus annuus]|uniref:Uncharacterized protein n=1 Tax=Helianthus annuus TaxID=4232 RepID=A0A9K3P3S5_HELAN|nr:hypothetical protein HanXRQr2_Chr01g0033261 [Helianthus annuus]KAJ0957844.1 hypothetical protein HanPSC8_Chr01g0032431 [Helianthus annuus]